MSARCLSDWLTLRGKTLHTNSYLISIPLWLILNGHFENHRITLFSVRCFLLLFLFLNCNQAVEYVRFIYVTLVNCSHPHPNCFHQCNLKKMTLFIFLSTQKFDANHFDLSIYLRHRRMTKSALWYICKRPSWKNNVHWYDGNNSIVRIQKPSRWEGNNENICLL